MIEMTELKMGNYPNIGQSFGITGIVLLGMVVFSPIYIVLNKFFDNESSMFFYYLLAVGIPFWIVYTIRKRETGYSTFNLKMENGRIIPFVIIATIALDSLQNFV